MDQVIGRLVATDRADWTFLEPGVAFALLKADAEGVSTLTRFETGAVGGWHSHPGGEELFVVSGEARVGGRLLRAGDYVETPLGARHRVEALTETLLFVRLPQLPVYETASGKTELKQEHAE